MALPHKPMIMIDAPSFVNLPKPSKANGQIPAHIREFAKPNKTRNQIEISVEWPKKLTAPLAKMMSKEKINPEMVHSRNAFS